MNGESKLVVETSESPSQLAIREDTFAKKGEWHMLDASARYTEDRQTFAEEIQSHDRTCHEPEDLDVRDASMSVMAHEKGDNPPWRGDTSVDLLLDEPPLRLGL